MKRSAMGALGLVVVIAAGCAGGSGVTSPVKAPAPAPSTSGSAGTASKATGKTIFTIKIPVKSTASAAKRSPKYVSPATNSITFSVGGATPYVVPLTLGSSSCPEAGGFYTCTAQAYLPAGTNESLEVATYASTDGSGTPLAMNTLPETIASGQTNTVNVTLNGVVNTLALNYSGTAFAIGTASSITATVVAHDASGSTIVCPGSLIDVNGNAVAPTLTDSDISGATNITTNGVGTTSISYTISYTGAQIPSPTITASVPSTTFTLPAQQLRVDSAVIDGDLTVASSANHSIGSPWYVCEAAHQDLPNTVNANPSPDPSPTSQGTALQSPSPETSPGEIPAQLATSATLPSGYSGSVTGGYTNYAEIEKAPVAGASPFAYAGSVGICQDITIPSGTPALHLQVLEGGDDDYNYTDSEASLYATPTGGPHADGTLITTAPLATLFAEDNCWDAAGWEKVFLGAAYGGTGTGGSPIYSYSRFANCPETPGGTPPYTGTGAYASLGGYWYSRTLPIPVAETGGPYTLFLGVWRYSQTSTTTPPSLDHNAYYSFAYFAGIGLY
jgi:hypothetical protein